ncbi:MAG: DUF3536 domain-containing protein [Brevinematales bacterium]|nr:DUF3536 domain-containing protein [Brevinematales bacterium]
MKKNNFYLVIHGHFYQPPREDPYTQEIDLQDSAHPWHDWNDRITEECYTSNAFSRVLDNFGHIQEIINNYEYISFNFGPTLLTYLEKYHRRTYEKILEADFKSRERNNGHGNAIAQAYNHMILPLASDKDKITQIEWGIRDFEKRFERYPEGIWLPETAVNDVVVQFLIQYGIKFIILSPHQAEKIRFINGKEWIDVSKGNIDFSEPYIIRQPNGEIVAFFYNGPLSHAVSFNHLLRNSESFRDAILSYRNPNKDDFLLSIATDGEIYGHHEPFADMCLSSLIYRNRFENNFIFTNFGNVLEIIKPRYEVVLKKGNNNLGTSWSCAHGVDRWYRDCGCTTGSQPGWNQSWREPLRNALDYLREELYSLAEEETKDLINNVWKARNDYIDVVFIRSSLKPSKWKSKLEEFLSKHKKKELSIGEKIKVLKFMEALYNEMLMYTSCGWFFADISGIETVQVMRYSSYIFFLLNEYIRPEIKEHFLEILSKAKSNIRQFNDGRWIFENWIEKYKFTPERLLSQFILYKFLVNDGKISSNEDYYFYTISVYNPSSFEIHNFKVFSGIADIFNNITLENQKFIYYIFVSFATGEVHIYAKEYMYEGIETYIQKVVKELPFSKVRRFFDDWFSGGYSLIDIKYEVREKILYKIFESKFKSLRAKSDFEMEEYIKIIESYSILGVKLPKNERTLISYLFKEYIDKQAENILKGQDIDTIYLSKVMKVIKENNLDISFLNLENSLYHYLLNKIEKVLISLNEDEIEKLSTVMDFITKNGIQIHNRRELENKIYEFLSSKDLKDKMEIWRSQKRDKDILKLLDVFEKFNISTLKFRTIV